MAPDAEESHEYKKGERHPILSVYSDSLAKTCAQVIQKVQVLQCLIFSIAFFFEFPGTLYAGDLPEIQAHDRISRADKKHLFRAFHKSGRPYRTGNASLVAMKICIDKYGESY